ncbi:MAG: hypothetical protein ACLFP4_17380, partial [Spirochaetales bacterium]
QRAGGGAVVPSHDAHPLRRSAILTAPPWSFGRNSGPQLASLLSAKPGSASNVRLIHSLGHQQLAPEWWVQTPRPARWGKPISLRF